MLNADEPLSTPVRALKDAEIFTHHGHLPAAAAYCRRLGLVELVNRMVPTRMEVTPGLVVQAMVLDTLAGRTPLYRLKDFMAYQDIELLLGSAVPAESFHDSHLARALDAIFEAGPAKIVTALGIRATKEFLLDTTTVSYDTTSTSVWGDYRQCEQDEPRRGPVITHGHSKDHLPELKQFMTELLCVDRGVPIFGQILDGNSSDKTSNNRILSRISSLMARHGLQPGAFMYVADSAMVTEESLAAVDDNLFITRLPANYSECRRVIQEAVTSKSWKNLGSLADIPTGSNRPVATYKVHETTVSLYNKTYRAVVVHSSAHDKRRQKKLLRALAESARTLQDQLAKLPTQYFCEADARAAARMVEALPGNLHKVKTVIAPTQVRKPGRPPLDRPAVTTTRYMLSWKVTPDKMAVERKKREGGCFVLLANVPITGKNAMDGKKVLLKYKGQYCVESDFGFLKDPLIVNDVFIKKPHRIDVLGMILILSLMVWRLMERSMRAYIHNEKTTLIGWENRKTDKPTSFMMTTVMVGIATAIIAGQRIFLRKPTDRQITFLAAMGLTIEAYLDPAHILSPIIQRFSSA